MTATAAACSQRKAPVKPIRQTQAVSGSSRRKEDDATPAPVRSDKPVMPTLLSLAVGKPVIVLIFVFAIIGLLASESQLDRPAAAIDTVVGYVLACLGFALPLVIVLGKGISYAVVSASTQPATAPTVVMPLHTWRIDSVLLVVLSILVLPAGLGRYTVGRVEGILFVLAALTYLVMTVLAGIGI